VSLLIGAEVNEQIWSMRHGDRQGDRRDDEPTLVA
jgi:hypothetical protein